eukprot:Nitzschia sp. Nitz4//scaffold49_size126201//9481//10965//NITZ4_003628-RA/size126201-processed-gene-0.86-mRNA-1//-1//CDS//3329553107//3349//frame0
MLLDTTFPCETTSKRWSFHPSRRDPGWKVTDRVPTFQDIPSYWPLPPQRPNLRISMHIGLENLETLLAIQDRDDVDTLIFSIEAAKDPTSCQMLQDLLTQTPDRNWTIGLECTSITSNVTYDTSDESFFAFWRAIRSVQSFRWIGNSKLSTNWAKSCFQPWTNLKTLHLQNVEMDAEWLCRFTLALAPMSLRAFCLQDCILRGPEALVFDQLQAFFQALQKQPLEELELHGMWLDDFWFTSLLESWKTLHGLKRLVLDKFHCISQRSIQALCDALVMQDPAPCWPHLTELSLCQVWDPDRRLMRKRRPLNLGPLWNALAHTQSPIQSLHLDSNGLMDQDIASLADAVPRQLQFLSLDKNPITETSGDHLVEQLQQNPHLQEVVVGFYDAMPPQHVLSVGYHSSLNQLHSPLFQKNLPVSLWSNVLELLGDMEAPYVPHDSRKGMIQESRWSGQPMQEGLSRSFVFHMLKELPADVWIDGRTTTTPPTRPTAAVQ